jgi:PhzF family phenazine biosynthesis protein
MVRYYIVDAFSDILFKGNQAGVCILDAWLDDGIMQNIAMKNNLAETAFVVKKETDYELRWFTPTVEIDLCGHATLASAFILSNYEDTTLENIRFKTKSSWLTVIKKENL